MKTLVDPSADDDEGSRIADEVKAEYGALLTDIVFRIENPALFDVSSPETAEFTKTMVRWDRDKARLRPDQRLVLASELRVTFDAARAHAEHVGMSLIPSSQRGIAESALKAYRLSQDSATTQAERRAALRKAGELLESLMLHYMPTMSDIEAIEGGLRLALPGRIEG